MTGIACETSKPKFHRNYDNKNHENRKRKAGGRDRKTL